MASANQKQPVQHQSHGELESMKPVGVKFWLLHDMHRWQAVYDITQAATGHKLAAPWNQKSFSKGFDITKDGDWLKQCSAVHKWVWNKFMVLNPDAECQTPGVYT